jgi:hypothetical protein
MKRIIAAVSFAALAIPAFAFAAGSAPYEKDQFDRALPDLQRPSVTAHTRASAGSSAVANANAATGIWAKDHNFIAPAR